MPYSARWTLFLPPVVVLTVVTMLLAVTPFTLPQNLVFDQYQRWQPRNYEAAPHQTAFVTLGEAQNAWLHAFDAAIHPLPNLAAAARGRGALNFVTDGDGIVRRVPLVLQMPDGPQATLLSGALPATLACLALLATTAGASWLAFSEHRLLLDPSLPAIGILLSFFICSLTHHFNERARATLDQGRFRPLRLAQPGRPSDRPQRRHGPGRPAPAL